MVHICINELTKTGSDNDLSPGLHQVFIWTNAGILLIGHLETNFSEIHIIIQENALENVICEMASILSRPQFVKKQIHTTFSDTTNSLIDHFDVLLVEMTTI